MIQERMEVNQITIVLIHSTHVDGAPVSRPMLDTGDRTKQRPYSLGVHSLFCSGAPVAVLSPPLTGGMMLRSYRILG